MLDFLVSWWWALVAAPYSWAGFVALLRKVQMRVWRRSLVALEIRLPKDVSATQVANWLAALRAVLQERRWWSIRPRLPIGLEITANSAGVLRVLIVPQQLRESVQATVSAVLPGARLSERADYVSNQPDHGRAQVASEARLAGAGDPLAVDRAEDASRYLLSALQPLRDGETVRIQWLLTAARSPRVLLSAGVSDKDIKQTLSPLWDRGQPVLWASCRISVASDYGRSRARNVFARIWSAMTHLNMPSARLAQRLLPNWWVLARIRSWVVPVRRWPILTTSAELGGLLGLVTGATALPGLPPKSARALPPPAGMDTDGLVVARSNYPGIDRAITLSAVDRLRHTWILGPPGAGKSTLLCNMITQDIHNGHGLVLVDARGDLLGDVLDRVPEHRADDVIVIDPSDGNHIVGINPLLAGPPEQAAGFVFHVLHSIYAATWGPRTADIVRACLLTLTATRGHNGQPFTLIDLPELLTNPVFRRFVTSQPDVSPYVAKFWRWYETLPEKEKIEVTSPVLNKLRVFTMSTALRAMLGQSDGLRFADVLAQRKVVLVGLKKGLLGHEVTGLIGSLVISAVWQAGLARANMPKEQRNPFWLYADEFQDVVKLPLDLPDLLAQARGLGVGAILAHQYMDQLTKDLTTAVIGATRTQIMFQLGYADAHTLAVHFDPLVADELQNLPAHEVAVRPCIGSATAPTTTGKTLPMPDPVRDGAALAEHSRTRYGMPATEVDAQIEARTNPAQPARGRSNRMVRGGEVT